MTASAPQPHTGMRTSDTARECPNFPSMMLPATPECRFEQEGWYVWGASAFRHGDKYYIAYSRWPRERGFGQGWVTDSEIALAESDSLFGSFRFVKTILPRRAGHPDGDCTHNPNVITVGGRHYLYYMGNYGNGEFWDHRNHQRIFCAWADDPLGEWHRSDVPVLDVAEDPEAFDSLMVSNPSVCDAGDGRFLMIYKGVTANAPLPRGGRVVGGVAWADSPTGPFRRTGKAVFVNPTEFWSIEDPFLWRQDERFYALVKDCNGYFSGTGSLSTALLTSADGEDWRPAEHPLAFGLSYDTPEGPHAVKNLERVQVYFEDGVPKALLFACNENKFEHTYNIRIPLKQETP